MLNEVITKRRYLSKLFAILIALAMLAMYSMPAQPIYAAETDPHEGMIHKVGGSVTIKNYNCPDCNETFKKYGPNNLYFSPQGTFPQLAYIVVVCDCGHESTWTNNVDFSNKGAVDSNASGWNNIQIDGSGRGEPGPEPEELVIKYDPGTQGTWYIEDETYGALLGDPTPEFSGDTDVDHNPGWSFDGWSPEWSDTVADSVTYVAQWKANTNVSVIYYRNWTNAYWPRFVDGGLTFASEYTVLGYGAAGFTAPAGYIFTGWNTKADGTGDDVDPGDTIDPLGYGNVLYAQYEPINDDDDDVVVKYYRNWNIEDEELYEDEGLEYGSSYEVLDFDATGFEAPEGKKFIGWNTEADGSGDAVDPGDTIDPLDKDYVLYAQYEDDDPEPQPIYYTVTVINSFAGTTGAGSYLAGVNVTINAGTRAGYTFSGWTVNSGGIVIVYPLNAAVIFVMPANDVTVTANWTAIPPGTTTTTTTTPTTPPTPTTPTTPGTPPAGPDQIAIDPPTTTIGDTETPQAAPIQEIPPERPPLAVFAAWALLNLILTIVTGLIMAALLVSYFGKRKDEDEEDDPDRDEEKVKKYLGLRLLTIAATAIAVILFILTQDMRLPMMFVDQWTIWHVVITAVTVILAIFSKKTYEEDDYEEAEQY